ncbi:hypothetical protein JL720_5795 [Aureococcus anophagefferens]|nr:hypothetical protein JL720_5795 [Aureococcus anophagefferens]
MADKRRRAAVVGASLGGLSAAQVLQDSGFVVTVFEKHGAPFSDRGGGLSCNVPYDAIRPRAPRPPPFEMNALTREHPDGPAAPCSQPAVAYGRLWDWLRDGVADLRLGAAVADVKDGPGGAHIVLAGGADRGPYELARDRRRRDGRRRPARRAPPALPPRRRAGEPGPPRPPRRRGAPLRRSSAAGCARRCSTPSRSRRASRPAAVTSRRRWAATTRRRGPTASTSPRSARGAALRGARFRLPLARPVGGVRAASFFDAARDDPPDVDLEPDTTDDDEDR